MIEIILFFVIAVLCGLIAWIDYNARLERKSMLNALLAKNAQDMVNLELVDKTKIDVKKPEPPDLVPVDQLSDDEFMDAINPKE